MSGAGFPACNADILVGGNAGWRSRCGPQARSKTGTIPDALHRQLDPS